MRVDMVVTTMAGQRTGPLSFILKTRGTHDTFECKTDIGSLTAVLEAESGLPSYVVDLFRKRLRTSSKAPLYGVRLSDQTLQKLGFFLD